MVPASFPESNHVLNAPADMTADECDPLSVCVAKSANGFPVVISCWKLTVEELAEIKRTGRVWLWVHGQSMPPVVLTIANPFEAR